MSSGCAVSRRSIQRCASFRGQVELVDELLGAGADGVVVTLSDEHAMREFVGRYR